MKALRFGLCLLLLFGVAAHGAVEVWSESVVEIGAALLLLLWIVLAATKSEREIEWNPLNWPLLGFCGLALIQLAFHSSVYAFLTHTELVRVGSCWIFFFLATQAFRKRSDFQMLAWFVVTMCFAVSLFAIVQYFTSQDEIYWFRQTASGVKPFGPYVNRNHFAGFVELTLPTGLAMLALRGVKREVFPLVILLTIVPISAIVLSASRGGIIGLALAICTVIGIRLFGAKARRPPLRTVAVVAAAAMALIAWVGVGNAVARFAPTGASGISYARRASMVRGALHVFLAHPVSGAGLGTVVAAYPRYETMYDGKLVDHVHNDYAEALADTGLIGAALGILFLFFLFRNALRNLSAEQGNFSTALHAGALASVVALLFHSFFDFNLHILSNALLFLMQAMLATAGPVPSAQSRRAET